MRLCRLVCGLVLALSVRAMGSDLAVLHNGFSIRHDRREVVGSVTRLYVSPPATGYVDVPTEEIDHFEPDLSRISPRSPRRPRSPRDWTRWWPRPASAIIWILI